MINVFYVYALMWSFILVLYLMGWSNLCIHLDSGLLVFIIFAIISSFWVGYLMRSKMKFFKLEKEPKKTTKITCLLVLLYIADFLYAGKIPLLQVINGVSYKSGGYKGIPGLHILISAFAIFYSVYLAYVYFSFKKKKVLIEYFWVISFFILLMQRQNIFICILLFFNIWFLNLFLENRDKIKVKKYKYITIAIVIIMILTYCFGVFGNIRYGSLFAWNDYTMISKLGQMNSNYPKILPKAFFWGYTYTVTPLVNLNYNILNVDQNDNLGYFLIEFIPEFISHHLFEDYNKEPVLLPVRSLTASTAYVRTYNYFGYVGMYSIYIIQLMICVFIINLTYLNQRKYFVVVANCILYYFVFTFFANTMVYTTTALVAIYSFLCNIKIKKY